MSSEGILRRRQGFSGRREETNERERGREAADEGERERIRSFDFERESVRGSERRLREKWRKRGRVETQRV